MTTHGPSRAAGGAKAGMTSSLVTRLVGVSVAVYLVLAAALIVYWTGVARGLLVERAVASLADDLESGGRLLHSYRERESANVRFLAAHPACRGLVDALTDGDELAIPAARARLQDNFLTQLETHPDQFQVRLIGLADGGRELVRVERANGQRVRVREDDLQRKGRRPYFLQSLDLEPGEVYISEISLNVERGEVEVPHRPTLRIVSPVFTRTGERFGMIVVNADVTGLLERFRGAVRRPGASPYLLLGRGDFAVHPDPTRAFAADVGSSETFADTFGVAGAALAQRMARGSPKSDEVLQLQGRLLVTHPVHLSARRALLAVVTLDTSTVEAEVDRSLLPGLALSVLLLLAGVLPTFWVARTVARPLDTLTRAAEAIGLNQPPGALPVSAGGEVGALSRATHEMWQRLQRREAELRGSRARLDAIFEASTAAIFTIDDRCRIQAVNSAFESTFEVLRDEVIGQPITDLLPGLSPPSAVSSRTGRAEACRRLEGAGGAVTGRTRGGREVPLYLTVNTYDQDERTHRVGLLMDTSHSRVLQDVLNSSRHLRRLMESTEELFVATDAARRIVYLNPRAAEALGVPAAPGPLPTLTEVAAELDAALVDGAPPRVQELELTAPRGWFRVTWSRDPHGYYLQLVDITALKREQLALERSNRDLGEYAHVASHDLQEPLRKIRTFADRIQTRAGDTLDERSRKDLERMQGAAARMTHLIRDVLELSRVSQRSRVESVDIDEVLAEVLEDLDTRIRELGAEVDVARGLGHTRIARTNLRQLLQNLLSNALKFHRPGVAPRIRVARAPGATEDHELALMVEDEGIGLDPAYAQRIFEPFERVHGKTAYPGTGVGLAICRRVVEQAGGAIRVEPTDGPGSRFVFVLPAAARAVHA